MWWWDSYRHGHNCLLICGCLWFFRRLWWDCETADWKAMVRLDQHSPSRQQAPCGFTDRSESSLWFRILLKSTRSHSCCLWSVDGCSLSYSLLIPVSFHQSLYTSRCIYCGLSSHRSPRWTESCVPLPAQSSSWTHSLHISLYMWHLLYVCTSSAVLHEFFSVYPFYKGLYEFFLTQVKSQRTESVLHCTHYEDSVTVTLG